MIYLLRFYLRYIEEQLKSCLTVSTSVYSAHFITNTQIGSLKNSINNHLPLRFNSYLSAKKAQKELPKSLENSPNKNDFNSVLFYIEPNQIRKQYEDLILFPIATQFRIVSIDY